MDHHDAFAPPKAPLGDAAGNAGRSAMPLIVPCLVGMAVVLTRHHVVLGYELAQAGAMRPLEFVAMLLAFVLLPVGALLMSLRWRGALATCALAAVFAASAWIGVPPQRFSDAFSFHMVCVVWLALSLTGAVMAWADGREGSGR